MSLPKPKIGSVLLGREGEQAIVVAEGTTPAEALVLLVEACVGGDAPSVDHPAIVEAAAHVKVQQWRSTTKAWREGEGVEDPDDDWWAPHGNGKRVLHAALYSGDLEDLAAAAATLPQ